MQDFALFVVAGLQDTSVKVPMNGSLPLQVYQYQTFSHPPQCCVTYKLGECAGQLMEILNSIGPEDTDTWRQSLVTDCYWPRLLEINSPAMSSTHLIDYLFGHFASLWLSVGMFVLKTLPFLRYTISSPLLSCSEPDITEVNQAAQSWFALSKHASSPSLSLFMCMRKSKPAP